LPMGNRGTIDAVIATHAVVMDGTARVLWVSEGPHLMGRFIRFDLAKLLEIYSSLAQRRPRLDEFRRPQQTPDIIRAEFCCHDVEP